VWLAREIYGGTELRLAAIKLFALDREPAASGPRSGRTYRDRVVEEARLLCQVEHPSIVRFYSIASDEEGAVLGVAMEHLTGTPLDTVLSTRGRLDLDDTLVLGASIASALSAVHRAGLVHRDVKPANIIDSGGVHKLIDFGIAWEDRLDQPETTTPVLVDDLPLEVTHAAKKRIPGARTLPRFGLGTAPDGSRASSGMSAGTLGYVDPACLQGSAATPASDLYALGVVLFECVTGEHPAATAAGAGEGLKLEVLDGRLSAPRLRDVGTDAPAALARLVDALLEPDPRKRPPSAEWVAIELERIRGETAGSRRQLPPESVGPFRGLGRFEAADRDLYFGRSSETAAALELLRTHGTVALLGPSGSGKSSLARAGVLPRVCEGVLGRWPKAWDVAIAVPGRDPKAAILTSLAAFAPAVIELGEAEPAEIVATLAARVQSTNRGIVLFVDQLEELVTIASGSSQRWAAELLAQLAQAPLPGLRALLTARRDLLDALMSVGGLGKTLVRGSLFVEPMSDATWGEVLQQALAAYGYKLEDQAFADEMLQELRGTSGAMPLVQFALTELWNKRDVANKTVNRASLEAIGGISGSLERHAEGTLAAILRSHPDQALVRDLLLRLTTPQGTRATRRVVDLLPAGQKADLAAKREILDALENARLIVCGAEDVTLAHEALLTQWATLRGWVAEAREERLLAEEIERDAQRWSADPDGVPVWRKRRLAQAHEVVATGRVNLSPAAEQFVSAGRRAGRRAKVVALGASLAAAVLLGVGAVGYIGAVRANERSALERAAFEQSKAELERQKRLELEQAQTELSERQSTIDGLMQKLAAAPDQETMTEVKRQIQEQQSSAHAAQRKITASLPREPPATPTAAPVAPAATTVAPARPKFQTEP
jgi:serine/threonine protein kinase